MNLKDVIELGDIRLAYLIGCLQERTLQAKKHLPYHSGYFEYNLEELSHQLGCSLTMSSRLLDHLEALGYLERKHDLAEADQLRLIRPK